MVIDDSFYMSLAISEAWKYQGLTYPNPPVGAVILNKEDKILSINAHQEAKTPHAELNTAIDAYVKLTSDTTVLNLSTATDKYKYILQNHSNLFKDFSIYVTLEPCMHYGSTPPCSLLISTLGFKNVIIGSLDTNKEASGGIDFLKQKNINVKVGICKKASALLIEPFVKWQKGESFTFFKLAKCQNGVYSGGIISSLQSRELVHKYRNKIDLLVIGGNTVRKDRPTLDSRLVNGKAPDILIYSRQKEFDKNIPLFNIPERKVYIEDDFEKLKAYKYIMIEGGQGMLETASHITDWYLFFTSSAFKTGSTLQSNLNLNSLYTSSFHNDTIQWFKK